MTIFVAVAGQHVQYRLRTHNLAGRGDQGRIAEVLADTRHFFQHVVILILGIGLLQLGDQVDSMPPGT